MKTLIFNISFLLTLSLSAQNWQQITSNTTSDLKSIDFPSPQVGYISGSDSTVLKSIDGGQTWQRLALTGVVFGALDKTIRHINFIHDSLGYLIIESNNPSGLMYKSTDGGLTWSNNFGITLCLPKSSFFFDADNGIAVGAGCFSGETLDRLVNGVWQGQQALNSFDPSDELLAVDFLNPNFGFTAGKSDYIFRTTDGGINWDTIRPNITDSFVVTDIQIVDDTLAYATYTHMASTGGVLITTDGGLSWENYTDIFTFFYQRFYTAGITGLGRVYFGGLPSFGKGIIQYQAGMFWPLDAVDQGIYGLDTYGDSAVFAVGDSGYIIVNRDPIFIGVRDKVIPTSFKYYPNPVSDQLIIEMDIDEHTALDLIDINGRKLISQVIRETKTYLDFSSFPSGIYFIRIRTSSGIETKKIIKSNH